MLLPFNPDEHTHLIADLHYNALAWSTNSQLGKSHIHKIYKALAGSPCTFGYVWIQDNILIGYAIGSMNSKDARSRIRSAYTYSDIFKLVFKSLFKPLYFINAFETVFIIPNYLKKCGTNAEWIAWNTDKSHPKHRVASIQCYYALRKYYAENGQSHFIAQGEKRSKESEAYLDSDRSIKKKSFFQNNIYIIESGLKGNI